MSERVKVSEQEDAARTLLSWLKQYHKDLAKKAVAVQVGETYLDLTATVPVGQEIEVISAEDPLGLEFLRHSTAHLMAQAVLHLFPDAQPTIGPAIETGFYYDFAMPRPFTEEDLTAIEAEMQKLVKQNIPLEHEEIDRQECLARYRGMGNEFKVEILEEIKEHGNGFGSIKIIVHGLAKIYFRVEQHVVQSGTEFRHLLLAFYTAGNDALHIHHAQS